MNIKLVNQEPTILSQQFFSLSNRKELSELLEVDYKILIYSLYRNQENYYIKFSIPKKDGSKRDITAPRSSLKIIQKKLNQILTTIFKPSAPVYGYVKERNIVKNANVHLKNKLILNIDLENFFPSIHLGRVRGMFMAKPYSFPHEVATTLAQICCFEGRLPQGAPTSPIISNMICAKLDSQLVQLAKEFHCTYTRYADDITFSTSARMMPKELVSLHELEKSKIFTVGDLLKNIIEKNGFVINTKKVRVQNFDERQVVTGIKVNEKLNVSRKYIHTVRGMLHAWKRYGYVNASKDYYSKHLKKFSKKVFSFDNILRGKLEYIKNVKSDSDYVFRGLANKYEKIKNGLSFDKYPINKFEDRQEALWVIRCGVEQGSGFILKDVGLITCFHVIESGKPIKAFRGTDFVVPYNATLIKGNKEIDLAILKLSGVSVDLPAFPKGNSDIINYHSKLTACGFPQYQPGRKAHIMNTEVISFHEVDNVNRIVVKDILIGGYSGGPALNARDEVVGVVATGIKSYGQIDQTALHAIIPINAIDKLADRGN
jgi:hypothetical protein